MAGKPVEKYMFSDSGMNFRTGKITYGLGIDIKFKNQKKVGHTTLTINYCPLCGKSMNEGDES